MGDVLRTQEKWREENLEHFRKYFRNPITKETHEEFMKTQSWRLQQDFISDFFRAMGEVFQERMRNQNDSR